jgi:hypothetical protein
MTLGRFWRIVISTLFAGMMTAFVYFFDSHQRAKDLEQSALTLTRQIESQAESLISFAKEKQEPDPIAWALHFLAIGPENRMIYLGNLGPNHSQKEIEKFRFNRKIGSFNYSKIIFPETGEGIKIQIQLGYFGFLGTRTPWLNDLLVLLFFGLCAHFLIQFLPKSRKSEHLSLSDLESNEELGNEPILQINDFSQILPLPCNHSELRKLVLTWIQEARPILFQVGVHVKNLVREAKNLATTAAESRNSVETLDKNSFLLQEASLELENSLVEDLKDLTQVRSIASKMKDLIDRINQNSNQALKSYSTVFKTTEELSGHISHTTETLILNAKMIQTLKDQVDQRAPTPPPTGPL